MLLCMQAEVATDEAIAGLMFNEKRGAVQSGCTWTMVVLKPVQLAWMSCEGIYVRRATWSGISESDVGEWTQLSVKSSTRCVAKNCQFEDLAADGCCGISCLRGYTRILGATTRCLSGLQVASDVQITWADRQLCPNSRESASVWRVPEWQ